VFNVDPLHPVKELLHQVGAALKLCSPHNIHRMNNLIEQHLRGVIHESLPEGLTLEGLDKLHIPILASERDEKLAAEIVRVALDIATDFCDICTSNGLALVFRDMSGTCVYATPWATTHWKMVHLGGELVHKRRLQQPKCPEQRPLVIMMLVRNIPQEILDGQKGLAKVHKWLSHQKWMVTCNPLSRACLKDFIKLQLRVPLSTAIPNDLLDFVSVYAESNPQKTYEIVKKLQVLNKLTVNQFGQNSTVVSLAVDINPTCGDKTSTEGWPDMSDWTDTLLLNEVMNLVETLRPDLLKVLKVAVELGEEFTPVSIMHICKEYDGGRVRPDTRQYETIGKWWATP
jgi:hypothetical protein